MVLKTHRHWQLFVVLVAAGGLTLPLERQLGASAPQESAVTAGFEEAPPGPFEVLPTPVGSWKTAAGRALVDPQHAKSGKHCLQLAGGASTEVILQIADGVSTAGRLTFWAERWTSRQPFLFRIDKNTGQGWQEIYNGDASVRVGRAFLNQVQVDLADDSIRQLRFRCSSPPDTGILIDDLRLAPLQKQQVSKVDVVPFTLPAIVDAESSLIAQLRVETLGSLEPLAVTELEARVAGLQNMESLQLLAGGAEPVPLEMPVAGQTSVRWKLQPVLLAEGENLLQIRCRLKKGVDIDERVGAQLVQVAFSNGRSERLTSALAQQRLAVALRRGGQDGVHTYRIPGLVTTNRGTLIGVYDVRRRGGGDLPGDIDVGMSRSTDGGRTWEPMRVVMDMGADPQWRYDGIGDPAVLVDRQTGTIWVAATWSHGNRSWLGSGPGLKPQETGQLMLVRSDDDGLTWSTPINITEQVKRPEWCFLLQGPGKGITMRDGTIVFAAQYQDPPDKRRLPHSTILYSRDHGQTWQVGTGAFDDTTEAQLVESEPGVLMLNCRYNRKSARVVMTTRDMGQTWQKHPTSERALIEPGACMASLIDIDQEVGKDLGGWLLFSNPDSLNGRNHLTIKASPDRGRTWPREHRLLLDEGDSAGYSCLTMIDEETIGILYEGSQAQLTFQRIPLRDVLGDPPGSDAAAPDAAAVAPHRPLDVFVLTGQSNALGTVDPGDAGDFLPPESSLDASVSLFWSNRSTRADLATDPIIGHSGGQFRSLQVQQGEGAQPAFWGPEFGFARALVAAGQRDFVIIKAARAGGGNRFWSKGAEDDHMYRHLLQTVAQATAVIPQGRRYRIRAILYLQGESDDQAEAQEAGQRLERLLENLRGDLPYAEEARLLVGGVAAPGALRDLVRQQQAAAGQRHPGIDYVDTLSLQDQLYDGLHFNRAAKLELGQRLAERWLQQGAPLAGELQPAPVFGSHMVLQADAPLPIWGTAGPGSQVSVRLGEETLTTTADGRGAWQVRFPARAATFEPTTLEIRAGRQRVGFRDILVGEVWLCAGQSNMEWPLAQSAEGRTELADLAQSPCPSMRLLDLTDGPRGLPGRYAPSELARLTPATCLEGQWKVASASTVGEFSAVAWYFGRTLQQTLKVPIGLICPAVGGSPTEAWVSREALAGDANLKGLVAGHWLDNDQLGAFCRERAEQNLLGLLQDGYAIPGDELGPHHPFKPGFLWSAGIQPLIPFAVRGVIWYQGESNAESAQRARQHERLFPLLIDSWRRAWQQGDFPFLFVQLPALNRPDWPEFREGQRRMLEQLPHLGMAVTMDLGHPTDVHPRRKKPVGERLGRWALGMTYRLSSMETVSGPLPDAVVREGDSLVVAFSQVGEGLDSRDGQALRFFEICGSDGKYHPAVAIIDKPRKAIVVSSPDVADPAGVRYGWQPYPDPPLNLVNRLGLPASPFALRLPQ